MPRSLPTLALTALVGCNAIDYDDYPKARAEARCDYLVGCGILDSEAACVAIWTRLYQYADRDAAIDAGTIHYDPKAARDCVEEIRVAECNGHPYGAGVTGERCDDVFEGTLERGESCWLDLQCVSGRCSYGLECVDVCCVGTCAEAEPIPAIGEPCLFDETCSEGAYCDDSFLCAPRGSDGAACYVDDQCAAGLVCLAEACHAPLVEGDPCVLGDCGPLPLTCDTKTSTCQRLRLAGEPCDTVPCALDLRCDVGSRICVAPSGVGGPCEYDILGLGCRGEGWCEIDSITGEATCREFKPIGAVCEVFTECDSQYCDVRCEPEPTCIE